MGNKIGRPSRPNYVQLAAEHLYDAIEQLGDLKASGERLVALNAIFGLLKQARSEIEAAGTFGLQCSVCRSMNGLALAEEAATSPAA